MYKIIQQKWKSFWKLFIQPYICILKSTEKMEGKDDFVDYKKMLEARMDEAQRQVIEQCLKVCSGNKSQAAKRLGITRKTLSTHMTKLNIS